MNSRKLHSWHRLCVVAIVLGMLWGIRATAQVYSINAVGCVRFTFHPGMNLFANPLNLSSNTVVAVLNGLPVGSVVYAYRNGGLYPNAYYGTGLWQDPEMTLTPGTGVYLSLPQGPPVTVTLVGEVPQGLLVRPLAEGSDLVSSVVPQTGRLQTDLLFPAANGDAVYLLSAATQTYSRYDYSTAQGWSPSEPTIAVAQAFILSNHIAWSSWERTFSAVPGGAAWTDIGLRVFDGTQTLRILCESPGPDGALASALRIAKNGKTYGIPLVELDSPVATPIRIGTPSGLKAWAKPAATVVITAIRRNGDGTVTVEWTGGGTLQSASNVLGPWSDIPGATSPFTFIASQPIAVFRVRQ